MKIASFEIFSIQTGFFRLDGGAMFGVVPRVLWEKTNPPDDKNRILMALRCLVIQGNDRVILVDSGIGNEWTEKQRAIYAIDHSAQDIDRALEQKGLSRASITDVILTHLHFDHVGGCTRSNAQGKIELTFPKANIYVQEENLEYAHAPSEKDRASFFIHTIQPLAESGHLFLKQGNYELIPGVEIFVTNGHTPGHQIVTAGDEHRTVLFCGDTIPTTSHIPIPYVMAYDLYPTTTMEEKKRLLKIAADENWILVFPHDPKYSAATVAIREGKYSTKETIEI